MELKISVHFISNLSVGRLTNLSTALSVRCRPLSQKQQLLFLTPVYDNDSMATNRPHEDNQPSD